MTRQRGAWLVMAVFTLALVAGACAGTDSSTPADPDGWTQVRAAPASDTATVRITGTVRYLDLEGGLYVIDDLQGTRFNPTSLPVAFRVDGTAVEVEAERTQGTVSIGMVGPQIDVIRIRRLPLP